MKGFDNYVGIHLSFYCHCFLRIYTKKVKKKLDRRILFVLSIAPAVLVAMFRYNNGADYMMYYRLFKNIGYERIFSTVQGKSIEQGFVLLVKFCSYISQEPFFTFGVIAFIIVYLIFKACLDTSDNYLLSVILFFVTGVYFDSFNGLRQYIAVAIFLLSLKYIISKDLKKYVLLIFLGFIFHRSIIFVAPIYLLQYLKIDFKKAVSTIAICVISGTALYNIFLLALKYTPYSYFANSVEIEKAVASQSSILLFSIMTLVGYWFYSKRKPVDGNTQFLFNCHVVMNIVAILTAFIPLMARFVYYGMAIDLLYIPCMLNLIPKKKARQLITYGIVFVYAAINIYGMIYNGWYTCIPYNFYFS